MNFDDFAKGYAEAMLAELAEAHHRRAGLKVGDKVRVHTDEVGTITRVIPNQLKSIHVRFSETCGGQYFPFECVDARLTLSDLAPETLERIVADCAAWRLLHPSVGDSHGGIFWDCRQLVKGVAEEGFPPLTPYLGDDGLIYLKDHPHG